MIALLITLLCFFYYTSIISNITATVISSSIVSLLSYLYGYSMGILHRLNHLLDLVLVASLDQHMDVADGFDALERRPVLEPFNLFPSETQGTDEGFFDVLVDLVSCFCGDVSVCTVGIGRDPHLGPDTQVADVVLKVVRETVVDDSEVGFVCKDGAFFPQVFYVPPHFIGENMVQNIHLQLLQVVLELQVSVCGSLRTCK